MEGGKTREWITLENEGYQLFGVVHRPLREEPVPLVLTCHGFGGTKVGRFRLYVSFAEALADAGIGVLRLDFRGSGDSEGHLPEITVQGQISDALAGLNFIEALPWVDPKRIGILGASLGGAVAVNAAAAFQKIHSMALWAPLFCPEVWLKSWAAQQPGFSFSQPTVEGWPVSQEFIEGFMMLDVEEALSSCGKVPLCHIHGEQDELVHLDHADGYEEARREADSVNEFIRLPHADHIFTRPEDRKELVDLTAQWFVKTLNA